MKFTSFIVFFIVLCVNCNFPKTCHDSFINELRSLDNEIKKMASEINIEREYMHLLDTNKIYSISCPVLSDFIPAQNYYDLTIKGRFFKSHLDQEFYPPIVLSARNCDSLERDPLKFDVNFPFLSSDDLPISIDVIDSVLIEKSIVLSSSNALSIEYQFKYEYYSFYTNKGVIKYSMNILGELEEQ